MALLLELVQQRFRNHEVANGEHGRRGRLAQKGVMQHSLVVPACRAPFHPTIGNGTGEAQAAVISNETSTVMLRESHVSMFHSNLCFACCAAYVCRPIFATCGRSPRPMPWCNNSRCNEDW